MYTVLIFLVLWMISGNNATTPFVSSLDPFHKNKTLITSLYKTRGLNYIQKKKIYSDIVLDHVYQNRVNYSTFHSYDLAMNISTLSQKCNTTFFDTYAHFIHPSPWLKISIFLECLPHYDWVVWMDMDILITRLHVSIQNIFMQFTQCPLPSSETYFITAGDDCDATRKINTGVWAAHHSPYTLQVLTKVLQSSRLDSTRYAANWEQVCLPPHPFLLYFFTLRLVKNCHIIISRNLHLHLP